MVRHRTPAPSARSVAGLGRGTGSLGPAQGRRRVGAAVLNTLTYVPGSLLHIPSHVGKGLAQGALPLALLVALTVNPKVRLRPNVFLCLVCLLVLDTVITSVQRSTSVPCTGPSGSPSSWPRSGC